MAERIALNPYLERTPVANPADFYGRTADVRWILERITAPRPQCCSITGLPRIGKSSLLRFLAHPEGARRRHPEFFQGLDSLLIVYVDLALVVTAPGVAPDPAAVLRFLARATHRTVECHLSPADSLLRAVQDQAALVRRASSWPDLRESFTDYIYLLDEAGYRLVLLLDELDATTAWDPQMAYFLRSLVMQTNTAYVTASLEPLFELLDDQGRVSPLYNIFSTYPLGLLAPDEARDLLCRPAAAVGISWPPGLVADLLVVTGAHPDLIKLAGSALWELRALDEPLTVEAVVRRMRPDAEGLFRSIWRHLPARERAALLTLAGGAQPALDALAGLRTRGLMIDDGNRVAPFGTLLADWLAAQVTSSSERPDLQLDGRWIILGNRRLQLTPTEARLARYLFARRGQTCSRDELIHAVWGEGELKEDTKVLDTTVQRLRDKIEHDRANPYWLLTVRGEGYMLRE